MQSLWFTNEQLSLLSGLRPKVWMLLGPGISREDVKGEIFKLGLSIGPDAVQSLQSLALTVLQRASVQHKGLIGATGRQEVLRQLLKTRLAQSLPELKRLKRQGGFFKRLDRAIQSLRLSSQHWEEALVFNERLSERRGKNPVREQILILSQAFESWLVQEHVFDPPGLLRTAAELLRNSVNEKKSFLPCERIIILSGRGFESTERAFIEALKGHVLIENLDPLPQVAKEEYAALHWKKSHSLQDAANQLAQDWLSQMNAGCEARELAILIPDEPSVRRALNIAFQDLKIKAQDPRDPTRLRWDEELKAALAPIEMVAQDFTQESVIKWLSYPYLPHSRAHWTKVIYERAIRRGLHAYSSSDLSELRVALNQVNAQFGKKQTLEEFADRHLNYVSKILSPEMLTFLQAEWQSALKDLVLVSNHQRKAPALFWLEWMRTRLTEATPPVERLRYEGGVQIFRLSQAPLFTVKHLWVLGAPPRYLSSEGTGDLWLSDRDRELLALEFEVRSGSLEHTEKRSLLRLWMEATTKSMSFMDFEYDWNGRERENLKPLLNELELVSRLVGEAPQILGAHPRWLPSFSPKRLQCREPVNLVHLSKLIPEHRISATDLDHYSKCPFMALAGRRWKLNALRPSDQDLWADVRGNLLHHAVSRLIQTRVDGVMTLTPAQALEEAWKSVRLKGFVSSPRLERYVRARLLKVLESFCESEALFYDRARTQSTVIENQEDPLEVKIEEWTVHGVPDRIDEHPASGGLFVIDYKTGSNLPSGKQMIEGFALQLPFYAVAARKKFQKEVVGAQFIELTAKGGRNRGIFFEKYNGKKEGCLTATTKNNNSLLSLNPDEVWAQTEVALQNAVRGWVNAQVKAEPKDPELCDKCRFYRVCGRGRLLSGGEQ